MTARALDGTTVLLTRPRLADPTLSRELRHAGARVLWRPTIERCLQIGGAFDAALRRLDDFDWLVFTSAQGVSSFQQRMRALQIDWSRADQKRVAVVGPATAEAARRAGFRIDVIGQPHSAAGLVASLVPMLKGQPAILYPRAASPLPLLADGLRRLGASLTDVTAYQTVAVAQTGVAGALDEGVNCVVFCSPSAIAPVLALRERIRQCAVACIGPTTARAATEAGLDVRIVPAESTGRALANAVADYYRTGPR